MNAQVSHTPGPWTADGSYIRGGDILEGAQSPPAIAKVIRGTNWAANARLIAAAPKLLEALIEAIRVGDNKLATRAEWIGAVGKARAAIAKATGAA